MKLFTVLLTLIPFLSFSQLASWDFTGENTLPTSTPEIYNTNLDSPSLLTRGSEAIESLGANSFRTVGFQNNGISTANNDYFQNAFSAAPGYVLSLTSIDARFGGTTSFCATPGVTMQYAYSLDGTSFTLIGSPFTLIGSPAVMPQIDLSGISALQNVDENVTVTIRFYASGQTTTGGWGYLSAGTPGTIGLSFGGSVDLAGGGCNITSAGITALTCNDATTGADPSDDYLTFNLNPAGATLGTTYSVSVSSGTISPTTGTYGAATSFQLQAGSAGAGNVTVTITDDTDGTCTFNQLITDPGACSSATPVITLTPASLTGFNHLVGTPSAEQTFTASGIGLTADIEINAPTNFQISLTTGTGFTNTLTLAQTSGVVTATTIYTRANAAAMGALSGNIVATSTGADNDTVMVSGFANDYVPYMVADINGTDANGVADSLNVLVSVTGIIQCGDFDYNAGYSFALIDANGDGINIFRNNDVPGYTNPMAGDSIRVKGTVIQFNGLTEIQVADIELLGTDATEADFEVVTTLSEATESMPVEILGLTLVTPIATFTAGANINATDGTNTIAIRIPAGSPLAGTPAPQGTFNITGIGWQFDSSSPYTSGYQIYPCAFEDVCTTPSTATTLVNVNTASSNATGVNYQWINCAGNVEISGATNQTFTAINNGTYAVIVSDGACSDTSVCITLLGTSGINENSLLNTVNVYPNPVNDVLTINNTSDATLTYTILDVNGKVMTETTSLVSTVTVSTENWTQGVYFVRFRSENSEAVLRVIK